MCELGIRPENFNPGILYVMKRKFVGGSEITPHSHDFLSLIFILSGGCVYNINGLHYPVKKGDVIACNPGVQHGKTVAPGEEISEFHLGLNNICREGLPKNFLISEEACPIISLKEYEQDFFKCCGDIMLEQEKGEPGWDLMLKSLVMKLVVILLKAMCAERAPEGEEGGLSFETYDKANIVNAIISFINENYMKDISLEKISRNMYLSPAYISRIFKEEAGDSPINYLIKTRLSKAEELLKESGVPVKAAAKGVGYDDAYYFSKLFKKYYGMPPSKYRQKR